MVEHTGIRFLSDEQLDKIEETAHQLLEDVGIVLDHSRATEMLHGLGCRVENGRVLIPPDVVHWALANIAPATTYRSVDGSREVKLGDGVVRTHTSAELPYVLDYQTGKRRCATLQDMKDAARVLDALPNVDVILPFLGPQDVPPKLIKIAAFECLLRNTKKPVTGAAERPEDVHYMLALAAACCGEEEFRRRPTISLGGNAVSPLRFTNEGTGVILAAAEAGVNMDILASPSMGATGPITMAGILALQHAEILAGFVIAAAARPGVAVRYGSRLCPINLRTATTTWGNPEMGTSGACAVQLAHRLGLPCDSYGFSTSSSKLDPQFAYEKLANALIPALAGVDMLSGVGSTEDLLTGSLEGAVIDDEMISLVRHITRGYDVSDETLAFDVMRDVILSGDVFLGQLHTVQQMRKGAIWIPSISEREVGMSDNPEVGVLANARARVHQILATHEVEPLADSVSRQLDEIVAEARRHLAPE